MIVSRIADINNCWYVLISGPVRETLENNTKFNILIMILSAHVLSMIFLKSI